jgi:CRP/FNR family transcriptional regulator, cyclic AMP receptor protein
MKDLPRILELLRQTPFFGGLAQDELEICARHFTDARFAPGENIFLRGDAGAQLFLVAAGRVKLSIISEEGRELSVRHASEGALLGEIAALDGGERTADAVAMTAVQAFSIRRERLTELAATYPRLSHGVIAFLCLRLRETTDQLENIALHLIEERLTRFLLVSLAGRTAPPGEWIPLDLDFSQTELAQLLGASRPKVNAALGALEKAGAVRRGAEGLMCDPGKLARFSGMADG